MDPAVAEACAAWEESKPGAPFGPPVETLKDRLLDVTLSLLAIVKDLP